MCLLPKAPSMPPPSLQIPPPAPEIPKLSIGTQESGLRKNRGKNKLIRAKSTISQTVSGLSIK